MAIPNGGLINETNAQYYAGVQQFQAVAQTATNIPSDYVGQTFISTFDTNLVFSNSDPGSNGYNLNNFKIFTSPDANVWTELVPNSPVASTPATAAGAQPAGQGTAANPIVLAAANTSALVGMTMTNTTGTKNYGKIASLTAGNNIVLETALLIPILVTDLGLVFKFISPWVEANNIVTINASLPPSVYVKIQMNENTLNNIHGSYEYTRLQDVIDNFLIAYVGVGKLITNVKRSDVIFHAKRGLQEFSYDTLKSIKSQELEVPPSLSLIIPQDYVNYVKLSWIDNRGVLHPIYPSNNLNQSPYETLAQNNDGTPIQDSNFSNTETTSPMNAAWNSNNPRNISGALKNESSESADVLDRGFYDGTVGQRYGLEPQTSQKNGWFKINERQGTFGFTSNLKNKSILLEYISDGNAYDLDARIPKLAEEALYTYIIHAILSVSVGIQEYVVRRFQKEKSAKLRNAKIRLSNLKLDQIIQVMRGKSKWIK